MSLFSSIDPKDSEESIISKLKGSRLVLPTISIGNVPQLSTDLLVYNFNLIPIGRLNSQFLYPFASPQDYVIDNVNSTTNNTTTALDLYFNESLNLTIIQQRSPILPGYHQNFINYIVQLINNIGFESLLILDSNESALQTDVNYNRPLELYSNDLNERFKSLRVTNINDLKKSKHSFTKFTNKLVESIQNNSTIDNFIVSSLVIFVYEGDNTIDAQVLTKEAIDLLEISQPSSSSQYWKVPKSWSGVYGDRPLPKSLEEGLFG
ncbi:hypothetical protein WICMUC_001486 [Wickerhamomyces mucosus]|uniref:Proteasome assembly chaperone 2 n=1 Tax=Wickerhamomyces mucosus TaxID=1378264 RepID=A0A9P8TH03_9ASCO|nr:hypothetical protein WICMUC_001486 [Wickerhamomyces mucosus]